MATVGLDINERGNPMAVAGMTMERRADGTRWKRTHRDVWALENLSASSHNEAVRRVAEIVEEATRRAHGYEPKLYGNVTSTGRTVLGALRGRGIMAAMKPVYVTAGDERTEKDDVVRLGTGWLLSRLQDFLQEGLLHLPNNVGAQELKQELLDHRHADESLGPLMTALGLAVQEDWSGILGIITFGGPAGGNPYRNLSAERAIRQSLDRSRSAEFE